VGSTVSIDGDAQRSRVAFAQGLCRLLADSYTLYLKTHQYHWNVTGPMFNTLHLMFEQPYSELALAVDPIAESARDEPSADLLTQRMQVHEKNAWMLRSLLG